MLTGRGDLDRLELTTLPVTEPGPDEVRLRVRATGAGGTDVTMRRGSYMFAPDYPFVPGYEVIGEVEALGSAVVDRSIGARVAALVVHGGYAEKIVVPARLTVPVPEAVDDADAVALVLNYGTAYQAIHRVARVRAGDVALVTGASGGVGTALLELLALSGVRTFGAASVARHTHVQALGASALDSRSPALAASLRKLQPGGVDVTFDTLGGRFIAEATRATRLGGRVVGIGFSSTQHAGVPDRFGVAHTLLALWLGAHLRGRRGNFYGISYAYRKRPEPLHQDLAVLFELLAAGKLRPRIAARLPLLAAREAGQMLERGGVEGKIVHLVP